ncbi:thioesterase [Micromonospora sp. C31]|uniref:thioesterase II family protein n=1 Tax=Micromonospora sp. C31 TaxID=2824876 RepID=UPI001B374BBB|nr:thioesterase [Micromonospora sp. C31]MBQ1074994.1 thioesterase [Micromonospora sp. C31]
MAENPWLVVRAPVARPALRLFCLPYAGGNAGAFETWRAGLPRAVEVNAVQYPGRRERAADPAPRRMTPLVQALEAALAPHLDRPYAVYGDCLGAYVAFELVRRLERRGHRPADLLVVSSAVAPHRAEVEPDHSGTDDATFLAELVALGTMPAAVAAHPELAAAALPAARADFELGRSYRYRDAGPIGVGVTAVRGDADPHVGDVGVAAWAELTTAGCTTVTVPGGHDLLARADPGLLGAVRSALLGKEPS